MSLTKTNESEDKLSPDEESRDVSNSPSVDVEEEELSKGSSEESDDDDNVKEAAGRENSPDQDRHSPETGGSESEGEDKDKDATPKPKKPIFLNLFLRCTSKDLLDGQCDLVEKLLEENEIGVKEFQSSAEPSWIRLGQVELEKREDVDKALTLNGNILAGKEVRVEKASSTYYPDRLYAPDDCILFVRNLTKSTTEETIHSLFPKAKEVRLPKKNGRNRGFAFINFATKKEVTDLIRDRQSEEFDGKTLKLGPYTSKDKHDSKKRPKGTPSKKSPVGKLSDGKSPGVKSNVGRSGGRQQHYQGQYGGQRYHNHIQSLLEVDTSAMRGRGARRYRDYDNYGYYNGDYALENYLYDLHSRMGLESGLVKRMGLNHGYPTQYGMDNHTGVYGMGNNLGYGQRYSGNRSTGFDYGNQGGYMDGSYKQSDKKRNRSGGNRQTKGKSGWPAK